MRELNFIYMRTSSAYLANIFGDILKDVLLFPLWWYSVGLLRMTIKLKDFIADREKSLALFIWIKNVFIPMYGQRDWQGILISLFIRFVQIIFRSIIMIFWLAVALGLFWLWVIAPIFIIYQIIWQIFL